MCARSLFLPSIYPITDTRISGLSHFEQAKRLIDGGAHIIQLRDKHATPREFYAAAKQTFALTKQFDVPLIINDRVDIALAIKADGVHLGHDDLPPDKARKILGEEAIIGFSTHSVKQAKLAVKLPIDYLAIGPIFPTKTKKNPDDIVGLLGLRAVREAVGNVPLVAIGGVNDENLCSVLAAGADCAALISSLLNPATDISARMTEIAQIPSRKPNNVKSS